MAVTIARRKIPCRIWAGQIIQRGSAASIDGVKRMAATTNWMNATRCHQLINDFFYPVIDSTTQTEIPDHYAWGGRYYCRITPGWTVVQVRIRYRCNPGTVNSDISVSSRTGNYTWTVSSATYATLSYNALDVSSTGVEEISFELAPGAGETVYVQSVSVSEVARTSI